MLNIQTQTPIADAVTFGKKEILQTITDFVFVKESPRHREQENSQLIELGRTPIKVDNLRHYLKIYPNRDDAFVLLGGFTGGFRVNYTGQLITFNCKNIISTEQHEAELKAKISKKIEADLFLICAYHL